MRQPTRVLLVLAGCALVAACGSPRPHASVTNRRSASALSQCMRDHGVSGFPDPRSLPGGSVGFPGGVSVVAPGQIVVMGTPFTGPTVASAMQACAASLPPSGPAATIPESVRATMIARARCLRRHGVPNFPDPTFPARGGVEINLASVDPTSPAFRNGARACQRLLDSSRTSAAGFSSGG